MNGVVNAERGELRLNSHFDGLADGLGIGAGFGLDEDVDVAVGILRGAELAKTIAPGDDPAADHVGEEGP